MNDIIEPTIDYDFSKLYLGPPSTIAGGAYFTRIMYSNNKQLYIQTPKGLTKQGFVKSGKKIYVDLMFDNNDTVFINWIENLESKCQELIFSKGDNWFQTKLDKDDIETAFTSPFKIYKSGKYYLLRVAVKPTVKIFNDDSSIITLEEITSDKTLISIIEIQGIKFTSRNFQIEMDLKQSMVVSPDPFLDACFIKQPIKNKSIAKDIVNGNDDDDDDEINNDTLEEITTLTISNDNIKTEENAVLGRVDTDVDSSVNLDVNLDLDLDLGLDVEDIDKKTEMNTNINSKTTIEPLKDMHILDIDNENIVLEIEDLSPEMEDLNSLKEVDLSGSLVNNLETITLKKPNQVYYEIYKQAREKAKEAKKAAILAFLEAKNIKKTYMLDDLDESDDEMDELDEN
jgi:hypothetical protein